MYVESDERPLPAGANSDGCSHGETGEMAFLLRFPTPKSVFAIVAGERLAVGVHRAGATEESGLRFTTYASLGAFGFRGEEEVGATLADGVIHPVG